LDDCNSPSHFVKSGGLTAFFFAGIHGDSAPRF
jgi:hypothetical protein